MGSVHRDARGLFPASVDVDVTDDFLCIFFFHVLQEKSIGNRIYGDAGSEDALHRIIIEGSEDQSTSGSIFQFPQKVEAVMDLPLITLQEHKCYLHINKTRRVTLKTYSNTITDYVNDCVNYWLCS